MLHKQYLIDIHGNNQTELDAAQVAAGEALSTREIPGYASTSRFSIRRRERRVVRYPDEVRRAKERWLNLLLLVAVLEAGAAAWLTWRPASPPAIAAPTRLAEGGEVGTVLGATASVGERRVYAFSVVPGGVTSKEELARVIGADRVVARHYADINVPAVRAVKGKARSAYVSYRRGDQIFWTRHRVELKEDELVLSDGEQEIRGRCGNRISDVSRMPVADVDPPHDLLDSYTEVPVMVVVPAPKRSQARVAQEPARPADIPEPGTIWLLAAGAGGLLILRRRRPESTTE